MKRCSNCGSDVLDDAEVCDKCGYNFNQEEDDLPKYKPTDEQNKERFFLIFFLGFIGSFIINHSDMKPYGYRSRTCAYFFLGLVTLGIYNIVGAVSNFNFHPRNGKDNIGYKLDLSDKEKERYAEELERNKKFY